MTAAMWVICMTTDSDGGHVDYLKKSLLAFLTIESDSPENKI